MAFPAIEKSARGEFDTRCYFKLQFSLKDISGSTTIRKKTVIPTYLAGGGERQSIAPYRTAKCKFADMTGRQSRTFSYRWTIRYTAPDPQYTRPTSITCFFS